MLETLGRLIALVFITASLFFGMGLGLGLSHIVFEKLRDWLE